MTSTITEAFCTCVVAQSVVGAVKIELLLVNTYVTKLMSLSTHSFRTIEHPFTKEHNDCLCSPGRVCLLCRSSDFHKTGNNRQISLVITRCRLAIIYNGWCRPYGEMAATGKGGGKRNRTTSKKLQQDI